MFWEASGTAANTSATIRSPTSHFRFLLAALDLERFYRASDNFVTIS